MDNTYLMSLSSSEETGDAVLQRSVGYTGRGYAISLYFYIILIVRECCWTAFILTLIERWDPNIMGFTPPSMVIRSMDCSSLFC
ncbi:hypothetical protein SLEP1_g6065 [Rubroshorea leprosula]|uniref:Uncharacterized protein n=1 Tax=Rubroshorea leprosula TaxID=152421 RepID=A0AAV5HYE3_9ROSI|nr:hypothetical protein SLEP1_g6065 [Rubroshorea leprosula]